MIPSGKNHNEVLLGPGEQSIGKAIEGDGMVLV
jgi:hypothetical protein